jgi:nitroreductase
MDVREAVASRFSCRAFLHTPVPDATVKDIVEAAARAPSGGNLQPWRVHALMGAPLAALKDTIVPRAQQTPRGEGAEYAVYPPDLAEPYWGRRFAVGEQLYASLGIARADKPARYRQFARNAEFFGAPVALFVSVDRSMGAPQWSDLGMFVQTIMLLARAYDLHTCAQEYWTSWHKTLGSFLKLSPAEMLFCGIALGYADPDVAINQWRSPRESLAAFARFDGFDEGP